MVVFFWLARLALVGARLPPHFTANLNGDHQIQGAEPTDHPTNPATEHPSSDGLRQEREGRLGPHR